jgi:hypothetical protein
LDFLKPTYKVLGAESCSGGDTAASMAANQNPPSNSLMSSFRESFISSGKQEYGATVLREGRDIVTRKTCVPTSLNGNNLGKAELHYVCGWGCAKFSLSLSTTVLM